MPLVKVTNRYSVWQRDWVLRITEVHALPFHRGAMENTEQSTELRTFKTRDSITSNHFVLCPVFLRVSVVKRIVCRFE